jgi:glycine/D-amino acid oxidase-like deaminating enzyme
LIFSTPDNNQPEPSTRHREEFDYLVIGQGICGTFLSYYLLKAGKKVAVIDDNRSNTASKVASGVINPVTGRRIVRTWMIEQLLPFAQKEYIDLGNQLGVSLSKECSVLDFHPTLQMKEAFEKRLGEEQDFLHTVNELNWKGIVNFHFGVGQIFPCLLIDLGSLMRNWREVLKKENGLIEETFDPEKLLILDDHVSYKNLLAGKILYCDGVNGISNPFFKNLPYSPNKGEVIIASIPDLDPSHIYKQGLSIVPWSDGLFWIGSSYEWNFDNEQPTQLFRQRAEAFLQNFLKLPFEIVDHFASLRPANMERRPFVGIHPTYKNVGILNGMGTKGCSLAPYFAKQLADFLVEGTPITPGADVKRFERVLARQMD